MLGWSPEEKTFEFGDRVVNAMIHLCRGDCYELCTLVLAAQCLLVTATGNILEIEIVPNVGLCPVPSRTRLHNSEQS